MKPSGAFAAALLLSGCVAWPSDLSEAIEAAKNQLLPFVKRQQASTSFNLSFSATQGNTATSATQTTAPTSTGGNTATTGKNNQASTTTGAATNSASNTDGGSSGNGTSTGTNSPATTAFDPRLPPGGISMINPNPLTTTFYKIEDYITFAWNYTSVSILPSAIDILAVGSVTGVGVGANPTFTLAMNQSVSGNQGSFTWNTSDYQLTASPTLRTNYYTLVIHDAAKDVSATPSPGYLDTQDQFVFAMYLPSPYVAYADWKCATCSGAMTTAEKQTMFAVFSMAAVTVLSFTWFAGVAGLW